ncbi:16S rRNA (cytosine(967)-C(5))-methyltransferase [hydrothermal vent metagenome]|uniref:16S rRNA (Cytosine(967)-C(5))-methyltransferase n=1 Tax=hydrothermal vent metagenome TaxID=652676 RepID=A0A3B1DV75_9ZZZZ
MSETSCQTRLIAFDILNKHRTTKKYVADLMAEQFSAQPVSDANRRFVAELVYGAVRRKATLDTFILNQINRLQKDVEEELWTILQVGCYQLAFMNSVPPHAAIYETVDISKQIHKPRWTKFINGVLRGVSRNLISETTTTTPTSKSFPTRNGEYRCCEQDCFPNPQQSFAHYFASAFSFPLWLSKRWAERFDFEELCRIGFHLNKHMPLSLRVNLLKTSREDLLNLFQKSDIAAVAGKEEEAILLEQSQIKIPQLPGFNEGMFVVQNPSALFASSLLAPMPGEEVLDLCAAPGTKTTHIAEMMQNKGILIATDVDEKRLDKITENATRLGLDMIQTELIDKTDFATIPKGPFDAILLDVPCSNTGVLNKRPEARWRIIPKDLEELPAIQLQLLEVATNRITPNGRIVYSTCSIEPEENQNVIATFLQSHPEMKLIKEQKQVPQKNHDGAYTALLQRQV